MLYLKPPYYLIDGVAVFADHANERQFYYLPAMPHLTMLRDEATGLDLPQIQLLKFRQLDGSFNGGFLTFEVNLGFDQTVLDSIAMEIKRLYRLRDDPILAPAVLESGSVRLIILGAATAPDGKPLWDDEQQQRFVVSIEHAASPALYGDNQAIFSVELDQNGVQLIEKSLLESELMPAGVIYTLDFLALRPAFSVRVHADWNRVQTHFEESFKVDVLFSSVEIDKVVDKLIEEQAVTIEVDSFLPEGEDAGSWVGRRDQAINDFKDMVLHNFFKPSLEPMKEEKDGWDRFADTAERLSLLAATGGWAGAAKFSYVKKDFTRIDQKVVNLTMNERVTVKRSIYPQATLKGLGRLLPRDEDGQVVGVDRFIQGVTLDDPWFAKRSLTAHAIIDFDNDLVESVNVTATYDGQPRTIRLTKATPDAQREWNSVVAGTTMVRPVEYDYRVTFKGVDTGDRPGVLVSPTLTTVGDEFEISPRGEELYFLDDIRIGAGLLPWDRFPQVAVEVRYNDPANEIRLADTFVLSKDKPEAAWKRFRLDREVSRYEVRTTFLSPDHYDIVTDWTTTDQERLIIRDPRPLKRTVQVAAAVDWRLVAMVFVELRYADEANGLDEHQTLAFFDTPDDRVPKVFSVNLADPNQRIVSYLATMVLKDNRTIVIPASMTTGSTVVLRSDMAGHRIVTVTAPNVDFTTRGVVRMEARLAYVDAENGLSFEDRFTFATPKDVSFFEYDYVAANRIGYACIVITVLTNGLVQERDLGNLSGDRLVLPLG
jgi:hypothetical protein